MDLAELGPPDTEGSEHWLWYTLHSETILKATAYGRFGHDFDRHRAGGLVSDYLERIALSRELFEDSMLPIARFTGPDGTSGLLSKQDYIIGSPDNLNPSPTQVAKFLRGHGFEPVFNRVGRWIDRRRGIEVDDTHTANFILDATGTIHPIDLLIRRLTVAP